MKKILFKQPVSQSKPLLKSPNQSDHSLLHHNSQQWKTAGKGDKEFMEVNVTDKPSKYKLLYNRQVSTHEQMKSNGVDMGSSWRSNWEMISAW